MIQIGQPAATVDSPVEHLMACHRRIEERLATLQRSGASLATDKPAALEAIRKSILFLDSSGALHTRDEEESLFPRLRPHLTPEESHFLDELESQHQAADSVFIELKRTAAKLAASPSSASESHYQHLAALLSDLYLPHIRSEDKLLPPLARRTLTKEQLSAISEEMKARRK